MIMIILIILYIYIYIHTYIHTYNRQNASGSTRPICNRVDFVFLVSFCYSMRRSICRSFGSHNKKSITTASPAPTRLRYLITSLPHSSSLLDGRVSKQQQVHYKPLEDVSGGRSYNCKEDV